MNSFFFYFCNLLMSIMRNKDNDIYFFNLYRLIISVKLICFDYSDDETRSSENQTASGHNIRCKKQISMHDKIY